MRQNRRAFLSTAVLASAGLAASPTLSSAAPNDQKVRLAIATICTDGFGNQNHDPAFDVIPQTGFKNVEFNLWYPNTITPRYIQTLKERCTTSGLTPISLQGTGFGGENRGAVVKDVAHKIMLMQHCKTLGCSLVKFTGSSRGTNGGLTAVIDVCREIAPVAENLGVTVVLENHAGNVLETIADFEEVFAAIDSQHIGLCLDTGHFEGIGLDLHDVLDRFAARTLHVDLKDCRERGAGHDTVPFGEGVTDFDSFLTHLMETGYSGFLVCEQAWNEPQGDWQQNLKNAWERFRRWERG